MHLTYEVKFLHECDKNKNGGYDAIEGMNNLKQDIRMNHVVWNDRKLKFLSMEISQC